MTKDTIITYEAAGKTLLFSALSPLWITGASGLSEIAVDASETQGTGQVGTTRTALTVKPRDVTLNCAVLRDVEENRAYILSCIVPAIPCRLSATQNGETWYLDGDVTETPAFTDGKAMQEFQFSMHFPFPYWRSSETHNTQLAGLTALLRFPRRITGTWKISSYTASLDTIIENTGSVATEIDLELVAVTEVQTPEVRHIESGGFIRLNKTMAAGERAVISTVYGRKGITYYSADGTAQNGFRFLDVLSDLNLQLLAGTNTLRVTAVKNREGLRCTVSAPKGVKAGV